MYSATETLHWPHSRPAQPLRGRGDRWRWALVILLVTLAHLLIWNLARHPQEPTAPRAPRTMTAILVAPPQPEPAPIAEVIPEPPPPEPVVQAPPEPKPEPKPEPVPEPVAKPVAKPVTKTPPLKRPPTQSPAPTPAITAPPTQTAAVPQPAARAPLEAPRFDVAYLSNQPPAYPLAARRRGIEGKVLLRVQISEQGTCLQAQVKSGSGSELLDNAALDAVRKWRFVPARQGDETQVAWVEIPINFRLDNL